MHINWLSVFLATLSSYMENSGNFSGYLEIGQAIWKYATLYGNLTAHRDIFPGYMETCHLIRKYDSLYGNLTAYREICHVIWKFAWLHGNLI